MPKKTATAGVGPLPTDDVVSSILKDFGQVIFSGDDLLTHEKSRVSVSPSMDFAHGGGWQEGSFVVLSGPPRCGKTTTALHAAGKSQRAEYGSRQVIYLNAEARLEERDLRGIARIQTDKSHLMVVQSIAPKLDAQGKVAQPGKILTARDYLGIAERFLLNTTDRFIVLDSISAMLGESEWAEGLESNAIGEAQRLFAKFMRRMSQVISTNRHIFVGIVHLYSNVGGGMGPRWLEKMSTSANYGLATKFRASHFSPWTATSTDNTVVGQVVHWRQERSPLGPPNVLVDSYIRYGEGIDEVKELIQYGHDLSLLTKNGTWTELTFLGGNGGRGKAVSKVHFQGDEKVRDYLLSHEEALSKLRDGVYDGLGLR